MFKALPNAVAPWRRAQSLRRNCPRKIRWGLVQTRYLILAALVTGLAILAAAAVWFSGI